MARVQIEDYNEHQFKSILGYDEDIDWNDFEVDYEFPVEQLPEIANEY